MHVISGMHAVPSTCSLWKAEIYQVRSCSHMLLRIVLRLPVAMQNRTTIIVAHRLSTIVNVDTVAGAATCHVPLAYSWNHSCCCSTRTFAVVMSHAYVCHHVSHTLPQPMQERIACAHAWKLYSCASFHGLHLHLCLLCAVVGQGKIVEMGSYAELASAGGAFTSLMKIQMMGHEGEAAASAAAGDASPDAMAAAELARLSSGVQGDVKVVDQPTTGKVGPAFSVVSMPASSKRSAHNLQPNCA